MPNPHMATVGGAIGEAPNREITVFSPVHLRRAVFTESVDAEFAQLQTWLTEWQAAGRRLPLRVAVQPSGATFTLTGKWLP